MTLHEAGYDNGCRFHGVMRPTLHAMSGDCAFFEFEKVLRDRGECDVTHDEVSLMLSSTQAVPVKLLAFCNC